MLDACARVFAFVFALGVCSFPAAMAQAADSPTPDRVLVVYNSNWPLDGNSDGTQDSLEVAQYYCAKRGIPQTNVLGLNCSTGTDVGYGDYDVFLSDVAEPLKAKLSALGSNQITVIVFCYGVPYMLPNAISLDNAVMCVNYLSSASRNGWFANSYFAKSPGFETDVDHFDPTRFKDPGGNPMYMVSRLDGPRGVSGVLDMIDQALYGERYVSPQPGYYQGYGYVDSRNAQPYSGTPYTDDFLTHDPDVIAGNYYDYGLADKNIAYAEHYVNQAGFQLKWENTNGPQTSIGDPGATFSDGTSGLNAPRALFYCGWYNYGRYNDVWGWLPGSVGSDLDSNSLDNRDIRTQGDATSFGIEALRNGATCFSGVLSEPYLDWHQRPNILLYYMLKGYTFAEASTLSTPAMGGWVNINIGDPLNSPIKAKTLVKDTQSPALVSGFPKDGPGDSASEHVIHAVIADAPEPEVVQIKVEYGLSTSYGLTLDSGQGFWRRHILTLKNLIRNSTYHYRLVITDPVGNVTTTRDYTFSTAVQLVGDFETPYVGPAGQSGSYQNNPNGSPWTFADNSGISGNGSYVTQYNREAPEGQQVAFLTNHGSMSRVIDGFEAGSSYEFVFDASQRGYSYTQDFQVLLDNTVIAHIVPSGDYAIYHTDPINPGAGSHTLKFVGLNTAATYTVTALIDNVLMFSNALHNDTTAPTVTIMNPSSPNVSTAVNSIDVAGIASDDAAVARVSWTNSRGGSGVANGTTQWNIATIRLQTGLNVITVTATDTSGNSSSAVVVVTFSPTQPPTNSPPVISSGPTAMPNPAIVGDAIAFTLATSDADADALSYRWDFADGNSSTDAAPIHTFAAAGTYVVSVVVSDGNSGNATATVTLVVNTPPTGGGGTGGGGTPPLDSDGDGINDTDEILAGTDPHDPTSGPLRPLLIKSFRAISQFKIQNKDSIRMNGVLSNLPANFDPNGGAVLINIGGATATFTLNAKGSAKSAAGTFAIKLKLTRDKAHKKGFFSGGDADFKAALGKGSWSTVWADEGVSPTQSIKSLPIQMDVKVTFAKQLHGAVINALLSEKSGRTATIRYVK